MIRRALLALCCAVLPAPTFSASGDVAPAVPVPAPVAAPWLARFPAQGEAVYRIVHGKTGLEVGRTRHTWRHDGHSYTLRAVNESAGVAALLKPTRVVQESRGELRPEGLRPAAFRHEKKKATLEVEFDWAQQRVEFHDDARPLPNGTQDLLSMYYQLALARPATGDFTLPIVSATKLADYRFERMGNERVRLGERQVEAEHVRVERGDQVFEFWLPLDPAYPPLPLRMRVREDGDQLDQWLERYDSARE